MQNEMDITSLEAKVNTDSSLELNGLLARFGLEGFRPLQKEAITAVLGEARILLCLCQQVAVNRFAINYLL